MQPRIDWASYFIGSEQIDFAAHLSSFKHFRPRNSSQSSGPYNFRKEPTVTLFQFFFDYHETSWNEFRNAPLTPQLVLLQA